MVIYSYSLFTHTFSLLYYLLSKSVKNFFRIHPYFVGNILPETELMASIQYILDQKRTENDHPVAVMTSQDRDTWSTVREKLVASGQI